jgi:hypothetical protein
MPTEVIKYRGYQLAIYAPTLPRDVSRILVYDPKDQRANSRPPFHSEHEALADARRYVDQELAKPGAAG